MAAAFVSCKKEELKKDMADPVVEITSTNLEGLPGEGLNLTAKVTDDLGIQYILIESADWEFSKKIPFSTQNYITEYNLTESIIIPAEIQRGTTGEVTVKVFDFAEKMGQQSVTIKVTEEPTRLSIIQEMGFNIVLTGKNAVVKDNNVEFVEVEGDTQLPVRLTVNSNNTKVKSLIVKSKSFGIDQTIDLGPLSMDEGKKATVETNIRLNTIPDDQKHEIVFTLIDEKGNEAVYNPTVSVKTTFEKANGKQLVLFVQKKGLDMSKVAFGLPMVVERKAEAAYRFTSNYYAEAGESIWFVNSKDAGKQEKYGISNDGKYLIRSTDPKPVVLKEAGYYEFKIDLLEGTLEVKNLGKQKSRYGEMYFVFNWADYPAMSRIDADNAPARWAISYKLKGGDTAAFGIGGGVWLVAKGPGENDPEIWCLKDEVANFPQYGNAFDTKLSDQVPAGEYSIVFDTFLKKAYAILK